MGFIPSIPSVLIRLVFQLASKPRLQQQPHGRSAVGDAEPVDGLLDMAVHRLGRDLQLAADLLGRPMLRGELQALTLSRRQPVEEGDRCGRVHRLLLVASSGGGRQQRLLITNHARYAVR